MIFMMIFFSAAAIYEAYELVKNKYWHELKVFSVFSLIAFIMGLLYLLGLPVINPAKYQEYIVKDLLHLNYK